MNYLFGRGTSSIRRRVLFVGLGLGSLVACGGDDEAVGAGPAPSADLPGSPTGTVTVLAAASLTGPFEKLGTQLEKAHPGLEVRFSFGPSSRLVEQALYGAPADVLATADDRTMRRAVDGGVTDDQPVVFARNTLVLAVPAGNPAGVDGLADLGRKELDVALCEPDVPCGAAGERLLGSVDVAARPDTLEADVKDVAGKIVLGEVDAGLVYRTDAAATDEIDVVDVASTDEIVNDYPVAMLRGAPNWPGAEMFIASVTGQPGQHLLADAGFLPP